MLDGFKIKDLRERKRLSQLELYKLTDIRPEYISRIEKGHISNVGIETLGKIAKALDCQVQDFLK